MPLSSLEPLDDHWADNFASDVAAGTNFKHTFTGSIPLTARELREDWDRERKAGGCLWAIFAQGVFVGITGLFSYRAVCRSFEFRILIGHPKYLGKGIGTEVTRMVVDWGFKRLNAHRLWLGVNAENLGAIKCYEKVGFKREGVLRDEIWCQGKYVDAVRYSILEGEWDTPKVLEM